MNEIREKFREVYDAAILALNSTAETITNPDTSLEAMTDLGFLCREMEELSDSLRKEAKKAKEGVSKILCYRMLVTAVNEEKGSPKIKGTLATATPKLGTVTTLPREGTPEYDSLVKFFGEDVSSLMKLHWPKVQERIQQLVEDGVELHPSLKPQSVYSCTYRRRNGS